MLDASQNVKHIVRMTTRKLTSIDEVVAALGGVQAVLSMTGRRYSSAISNWKDRGGFPPTTYLVMSEALKRKGASAPPSLWGMETAESAA